jgi:nucleoid DNA-binding protein
MKKSELAAKIALDTDVSPEEAADTLDRITHRILKRLRQGKSVILPGLGRFIPGPKLKFEFRKESKARRGRGGR